MYKSMDVLRTSCRAATVAPLAGPVIAKLAVVSPLTGSVKAITRGTICSFVTRPPPPRYVSDGERSAPRGLDTHDMRYT